MNINDLVGPSQNPNAMMPPGMPGGAPPMPPMPDPSAGGMPPGMPPAGAPPDAGSAPIGPGQRQELDRLFNNVQMANSKTVSDKLVSRNEISLMRKELQTKMFDLLSQAGVDPGNPESIKAFLSQLEQSDPDLLNMFETAFQGMAGGNPQSPDMGMGQPDPADPNADPSAPPSDPSLMPGATGAPDPGADLSSRFQNLQGLQ